MRTIPKDSDRCTFVSSDGRRCCMIRVEPGASFCFMHWKRHHEQEAASRIGDEIVGAAGALNSQEGIHQALTNVFANLARGRISPRSAAVLGYVGQLMLVSRPSLERALKFNLAVAAVAQKAAQQKVKSEAADADRLHRHALQELEISSGTLNLFQALRSMSPDEGLRFMRFVRDFSDKGESARPAPSPSAANPQATSGAASQQSPAPKPKETPIAPPSDPSAAAPKPTPQQEAAVPPPAKISA